MLKVPFKIAAVQASPVFLDREATVVKAQGDGSTLGVPVVAPRFEKPTLETARSSTHQAVSSLDRRTKSKRSSTLRSTR
jgi:hypothetical protein